MRRTITARIWRGGRRGGAFESHRAPLREDQTALDVLIWVRENRDPSLSYRFACRVGMCGSCAMTIGGAPRWACRTLAERALKGDVLEIAPLRNLPVIKDLAVDMQPFFDRWLRAGGRHVASADRTAPIPEVDPAGAGRIEAAAAIECINCAVCHSACDTVAADPDYLGPAPLQRAWAAYCDPKHGAPEAALDAASGSGGCHSCHSIGACAERCPVGLAPIRAIAGLKRASARRALGLGSRRGDR